MTRHPPPLRPATRRRADQGFTLVELLIVIVVLGILSGIVVFGVGRFRGDAQAAACKADVATVSIAADAYDAATGNYPTSIAQLVTAQYLKTAPAGGTYAFDPKAKTAVRAPECAGGAAAPAPAARRVTGIAGKCIDLADTTLADGTTVQLGSCDGRVTQRWTAPASWPGAVMVLGRCLDLDGGQTVNRTKVQLYGCNGTGAQVWDRRAGNILVNPQSGRCLDADGAGTADGTRLILWDCHGLANQQWVFA